MTTIDDTATAIISVIERDDREAFIPYNPSSWVDKLPLMWKYRSHRIFFSICMNGTFANVIKGSLESRDWTRFRWCMELLVLFNWLPAIEIDDNTAFTYLLTRGVELFIKPKTPAQLYLRLTTCWLCSSPFPTDAGKEFGNVEFFHHLSIQIPVIKNRSLTPEDIHILSRYDNIDYDFFPVSIYEVPLVQKPMYHPLLKRIVLDRQNPRLGMDEMFDPDEIFCRAFTDNLELLDELQALGLRPSDEFIARVHRFQ